MLRKSGKKSVSRKMNEMTTPNRKRRTLPKSFLEGALQKV
jgi:hypothetical protein